MEIVCRLSKSKDQLKSPAMHMQPCRIGGSVLVGDACLILPPPPGQILVTWRLKEQGAFCQLMDRESTKYRYHDTHQGSDSSCTIAEIKTRCR